MSLNLITRLSKLAGEISGWLAVPMMLMVFTDAVLRGLFNLAILGVTEISATLLVAMIYIGLPGTQSLGANFRVTILTDRMPSWFTTACAWLAYVAFLPCLLIIFWFCLHAAMFSWERGETSYGLIEIAIWPTRLLIAIGLGFLILQYLVDGWLLFSKGVNPFVEREETTLIQGQREEI